MQIFDITLPVEVGMATWPGDVPYRIEPTCSLREGAAVNLSSVAFSVHTGTHIDAPYHFSEEGATVEAFDLTAFLGPAHVVDVSGRAVIRREDLAGVDFTDTPRLLLKTNAWADPRRFPEHIPTMSPDVPAFLQAQGVILVGLDVPSVDEIESKALPIHQGLGRCGIAILESLALAEVPAGRYELIALPMKLIGADGAPVRALLKGIER